MKKLGGKVVKKFALGNIEKLVTNKSVKPMTNAQEVANEAARNATATPRNQASADIRVAEDALTVQDAINVAPAGGRVAVSTGVYHEKLLIDKSVELVGVGDRGSVVLHWGGDGATVTVSTSKGQAVRMSNLTIQHKDLEAAAQQSSRSPSPSGSPRGRSPGPASNNRNRAPSPTKRRSRSPTGALGGALPPTQPIAPHFVTQDREDEKRRAQEPRGKLHHALLVPAGEVTLEECDVTSAEGIGVVALNPGTQITLCNCIMLDCRASGVLVAAAAQAIIKECTLTYNQKNGVAVQDEGSQADITGCKVLHCQKDGVLVTAATAKLHGCMFAFNGKAGINFMAGSQATMEDCTCRCNRDGVNILDEDSVGTSVDLLHNILMENQSDNLYIDEGCRQHVTLRKNRIQTLI